MIERTTPENITALKVNEIFVFGSNLAGRHGAGAARLALKWGAVMGGGIGLHGQTYAFPTLNPSLDKLSIGGLSASVDHLVATARRNPEFIFLVTEVGCGIAGFTVEEVAPLFAPCVDVANIHLPERFWAVLNARPAA